MPARCPRFSTRVLALVTLLVWLLDHPPAPGEPLILNAGSGRRTTLLELAALAQATTRARIGHLVLGNTYRHPAITAKAACTLDHISDGRAGWRSGRRCVRWDAPASPK